MILVSLFDGAGGAYDSALAAGLRPSAHVAVEINPVARKFADWRAQKKGWLPARRPVNDVREATAKNLLKGLPDGKVLVCAGVPCNSRSMANTTRRGAERTAEHTESGLVREFARVLAELQATGREIKFVVENVPSAVEADAEFNRILGVEPIEVNAAAFGAQHRRRLFWANFGITPRDKPTVQWSSKTFRDVAETNPKVKNWYNYIPFEATYPRPFAPARVGVLATDKIIEQLREGVGLPPPPENQLPLGECEANDDLNRRLAAVCARGAFGGGISLTSNIYNNNKVMALCMNTTRPLLSESGLSRRVNDGDAKTQTITASSKVRAEGSVSLKQKDRIHDPDRKAPTHLAFQTGGNHMGKVAHSLQDRVISEGSKMKTIPANGGGRTEGMVGTGEPVWTDFGGGLILPIVESGARCLTILEAERLFSLDDHETAMPGLSVSVRKRLLGGGWDRLQMAHVLGCLDYSPGLL